MNDREDELLKEIDDIFKTKYINEDIIKKGEKLPKQIKISLEKGKLLEKDCENSNLNSYINDCINIENNIKNINIIKENINKCNINNKIKIKFIPIDNKLEKFLETIKSFGKIFYNTHSFKECPININANRKYIVTGDNKNILTKTSNNGWMGTICENELDKSIEEHIWKIKFLKTQGRDIMVGVATSDFDILSTEQFCSCGWYLWCYNSPPTLYSGPPFKFNNLVTKLSRVNDKVVVVMNIKNQTLKFIINGEDKGNSYTNIPVDKPLFPAICLYSKDDSVEIEIV